MQRYLLNLSCMNITWYVPSTTFANESKLHSVTLIPCSPPLSEGGIFRICATKYESNQVKKQTKVLQVVVSNTYL